MILVAVEVVPTGSKPPATVCVRISTGERHGSGAAAPLSTRASFLVQGRAGGPVKSSPKLSRHIESVSIWAEHLTPFITRSAATSSVRLRVFSFDITAASMARRGCRAPCPRLAERCLVSLVFSIIRPTFYLVNRNGSFTGFSCLSSLSSKTRYTSASVGWRCPNSSCWGAGPLPWGATLLQCRGISE